MDNNKLLKVKVKYLRGAFLAEPVTYVTRFSMPLGARLWHYAAELRTLSVTYPLCGFGSYQHHG